MFFALFIHSLSAWQVVALSALGSDGTTGKVFLVSVVGTKRVLLEAAPGTSKLHTLELETVTRSAEGSIPQAVQALRACAGELLKVLTAVAPEHKERTATDVLLRVR